MKDCSAIHHESTLAPGPVDNHHVWRGFHGALVCICLQAIAGERSQAITMPMRSFSFDPM
jgi:hypothetical protein